jgi:adenine phosphoribosyltransferase
MTDEALISAASIKNITPLLKDEITFYAPVDGVALATQSMGYDRVLAADARGFVFGATLAYGANEGLIMSCKPDKLPRKTLSVSYELEYVSNALGVRANSIPAGCGVLSVDDLFSPGGTARDISQLVEGAGILNSRELLAPYEGASPLTFGE